MISLFYLASLAGTFVFEFAQMYIMQYTGQKAMFDLRRQLMEHLQSLDIVFFDRNPVGRLVTRVTTDVDVLNELFASGLVTILGDVLTLTVIVIVMFQLSPPLTLIMLAVLPLVVLVTAVFRRIVSVNYRKIRIAIARINVVIINLALDPSGETTPYRPHPGRQNLTAALVAVYAIAALVAPA